jgi:hypothetical protein
MKENKFFVNQYIKGTEVQIYEYTLIDKEEIVKVGKI